MVIKDQRELIRARPDGQHGRVIDPWAAMYEHQRIAVSDDLYKERDISNGDGGKLLPSQKTARCPHPILSACPFVRFSIR
jgi:hypothetical protein